MGGTGLVERRGMEAEILAEVYAVMAGRFGPEAALDAIGRAVENAAAKAGAAFAASAPEGPSLEHFSQVLDLFRDQGQGMITDNVRLNGDSLSFNVVRCGFVEKYRSMGLDGEMAYTLSCRRDHPFARAYSPCLSLERSPTIAQGQAVCSFAYRWSEEEA